MNLTKLWKKLPNSRTYILLQAIVITGLDTIGCPIAKGNRFWMGQVQNYRQWHLCSNFLYFNFERPLVFSSKEYNITLIYSLLPVTLLLIIWHNKTLFRANENNSNWSSCPLSIIVEECSAKSKGSTCEVSRYCLLTWEVPRNTRHWSNAVFMLGHRLRRWLNIKTTLDQRLVFLGTY